MRKKKVTTKALAVLMSVVLVAGLCPASALARGGNDALLAQGTMSESEADGQTDQEPSFELGEPVQLEAADAPEQGDVPMSAFEMSALEDTTPSGITANEKPTLKELRKAYAALPAHQTIWKTEPDIDAYTAGVLSDEAFDFSAKYINLIRRSANLDPITLTDALNANSAQGALILARNDQMSHYPTTPTGVSDDLALAAKYACMSSNLSNSRGYSDPIMLAIQGQMDDDRNNVEVLGHRRWLINPSTQTMGIGSARSSTGKTYTDIRVFNNDIMFQQTFGYAPSADYGRVSNASKSFDYIAWPASGPFLNTLFNPSAAWSVTLGESKYMEPNIDSVQVKLTRLADEHTWTFNSTNHVTDDLNTYTGAYFNVNNEGYGEPGCIIFRPARDTIEGNTYEGSYKVEITGIVDKSTGQETTLTYQVDFANPTASFDNGNATIAAIANQEYTGEEITPALTVTCEGDTLTLNEDYTASYSNNTNVGEATVTITGKGIYSGTATAKFNITAAHIDAATVSGLSNSTYTGAEQKPIPTVTWKGEALDPETDYYVEYANNTNAGSADVIVHGKGNFWGGKSESFIIERAPLVIKADNASKGVGDADPVLTATPATLVGADASQAPELTKSENGVYTYEIKNLNGADISYTVTRAAGESVSDTPYAITVNNLSATQRQNYEITTEPGAFTITRKLLSDPADNTKPATGITVTRDDSAAITYDGKAHTPKFTLKHGDKTLVSEGGDYEVAYTDNTSAGKGKATFTGKGDYDGTLVATFDIDPAPVTVTGINATIPFGEIAPAVLATVEGVLGTDTVKYDVALNPADVNAGQHIVAVNVENNGQKGNQGNYTVTGVNGMLTVTPRMIADLSREGGTAEGFTITDLEAVGYTGSAINRDAEIIVKEGDKVLQQGRDYTVAYSDNVNSGTGRAIITGMGNYTGSVTRSFKITQADVRDTTATVTPATTVYNGAPVTPEIVLKHGSRTLTADDYTVEYYDNDKPGTGYAHITGTGNYRGYREVAFEIADEPEIDQFAGKTRFGTARMIVEAELELGSYAGAIIVAGDGQKFPDALSAAGLSGVLNYPLVMVDGNGLNAESKTALDALKKANGGKPLDLVIIGGKAAVSPSVENALKSWGAVSKRIEGADRYETNALIYEYGQNHGGWSTERAFIATGKNFPDALAIAPYLVKSRSAIVLVPDGAKSMSIVPSRGRGAITSAQQVVALGGTGVVSDAMLADAKKASAGKSSDRLWGQTRYQTGAAVVKWELDQGMSVEGAGVATAKNFPDALASGFLLGKANSVLVLVDPDDTSSNSAVVSVLKDAKASVAKIRALGGDGAVSAKARNQVATALNMKGYDTDKRE